LKEIEMLPSTNKEQRQRLKALRRFLKVSKATFATIVGPDGMKSPALKQAINLKSARVEAKDTTLGERIGLARDFAQMTNPIIAEGLGVTRKQVKRWCGNTAQPASLPRLAEFLSLPLAWLQDGGEASLPADSYLGQRVGQEKADAKELLYGQTISCLSELPDDLSTEEAIEAIANQVFSRFTMAQAARRAGGLWLWCEGELVFNAWHPPVVSAIRQARERHARLVPRV
jgi:DNA-binding transcriptional regulator YiaG